MLSASAQLVVGVVYVLGYAMVSHVLSVSIGLGVIIVEDERGRRLNRCIHGGWFYVAAAAAADCCGCSVQILDYHFLHVIYYWDKSTLSGDGWLDVAWLQSITRTVVVLHYGLSFGGRVE